MKKIIILLLLTITSAQAKVVTGELISAQTINSATAQVGEIKESFLSVAQFQAHNGDCWKLMDGASLDGTDLKTLTNMAVLPNAVATGAFLRQAPAGRAVGSYQDDDVKAHSHTARMSNNGGSDPNSMVAYAGGTGGSGSISSGSSSYINSSTVGGETRPKNIAVNMFVKVNNNCNFN